MATYLVAVAWRGMTDYIVEADSEEEAQDKAIEECEWDHEGMDYCEPGDPQLIKPKHTTPLLDGADDTETDL